MNFAANTPVRTPVRIPETILTPAISLHFVENFLTAQGRISKGFNKALYICALSGSARGSGRRA